MPTSPPSLCTAPGCGTLVFGGGRCPACRQEGDRTRGNGTQRGWSTEWARFSKAYLLQHPQCATPMCMAQATDVDHIDGTGRNGPRAYDDDNLMALCHPCHSHKTATQDGGFGRPSTPIKSKMFDRVFVGSDLWAPSRAELTVTDMDDLAVDITAVLVLEDRRYVVEELRVTRRDGGAPITSELIRRIAVQGLIRGTVSDAVELRIPQPSVPGEFAYSLGFVMLDPEERDALVAAGPTDETLLWVARIYVMAELAGDPPAKSVRENLAIPESTANNWIRRAKDRGILNG